MSSKFLTESTGEKNCESWSIFSEDRPLWTKYDSFVFGPPCICRAYCRLQGLGQAIFVAIYGTYKYCATYERAKKLFFLQYGLMFDERWLVK